jgi:small-conductance mechanosensitive channel
MYMVLPSFSDFSNNTSDIESMVIVGNITVGDIFLASIILVIGYFVIKKIAILVEDYVARKIKKDNAELIYRSFYYPMLCILILTVLNILHINITGFLATAGVIGIIIGFAAQNTVSNIISGLFLLADDNFEIGDIVEINGETGIIIDIGFMFTKIKSWDNLYVTLPNKLVADSKMVNISKYSTRRILINFVVDYGADLDKIRTIANKVASDDNEVATDPAPKYTILKLGDNGIECRLEAWVPSKRFWPIERRLTEKLSKELDKNKINLPYPQRTINMKS